MYQTLTRCIAQVSSERASPVQCVCRACRPLGGFRVQGLALHFQEELLFGWLTALYGGWEQLKVSSTAQRS